MNIEIVEFYPIETKNKNRLDGTLHIYLIDLGVDLRGIYLTRWKGKYMVFLPSRKGIDLDTNKEVRYPIFSFMDREKTNHFINEIKIKAAEYIEKTLTKS